jgi:glycosyltransferase
MKSIDQAPARTPVVLSVVCATWNAAACVARMLHSYREERTTDCELIMQDGASSDGTWDLILQQRDIVAAACSERDAGIYDAWNRALRLCRGRYVAFIGADDIIAPGALAALVSACVADDGESHVIAGYNIRTQQGVPQALLGCAFERSAIVRRMPFAHVMAAHRLTWLTERGGFDASLRSAGDYDLMVRDRDTLRVQVIPKVLAWIEDGGVSRQVLRPHLEHFRVRRKHRVPAWICGALFVRELTGSVWRHLGNMPAGRPEASV